MSQENVEMRFTGMVVICGAALCVFFTSGVSPAASARPTCFGDPATIVGTPGDDRIRGTNQPDVIVARGGNDVVRGRGGHDRICAGRGEDEVHGGTAEDFIRGSRGADVLR